MGLRRSVGSWILTRKVEWFDTGDEVGKREIDSIREDAEFGRPIAPDAAMWVLRSQSSDLPDIFAAASSVRRRFFGNNVYMCSILNARSGACSEDCAFCAQAARHKTNTGIRPLLSKSEIIKEYEEAAGLPIARFGVVTSGCALSSDGIERLCEAVRERQIPGAAWCASLGCLEAGQLAVLKDAGLSRFHHNLETAESFFPQICTTHSYEKRLNTVRAARAAGLEVCCGGILGLGESLEQRVEFAGILAREQVDSIPLNFLIPIPGTRLEHMETMRPLDMLRSIAMFRLTNPRAEILVCAGRVHLGALQSMIFHAGATGMMIGRLLTVAGCDVEHDLRMLRDMELDFSS